MIGLGGRGFWGSRLTHFRIFYKKPAASAIFQARCIATTSHAQATRTTFASSRSRFDSVRPSHRLRGQSFCTSVKMAEKWPASKVREEFLRFFEEKEHTIGTPNHIYLLLCTRGLPYGLFFTLLVLHIAGAEDGEL